MHPDIVAAQSACEINHMPVVGQVYSLTALANLAHQAAGGGGSGFVEGLEDIVAEKRSTVPPAATCS